MRCAILLICAGIASATLVVDVQSARMLALCIGLALLMLLLASLLSCQKIFQRFLLLLLFFFLGFNWHLGWANARLATRLSEDFEGKTLQLNGVVASLPQRSTIAQQFHFLVLGGSSRFRPRKIVLNYYGDKLIEPGQYWRFTVRLNRPHGFSNPGGFDYEAWLLQQGVDARGYVRRSQDNALIPAKEMSLATASAVWISSARYAIKTKLQQQLDQLLYGDLLIALLLGDRSLISQENWRLFTATGTNHLFVISGLHIGMVSGFIYWLVLWVGKMFGIAAIVPAQKFASGAALMCALAYSLLAGFTLPTQRAFIMIAVLLGAVLCSARLQISFRLLLALFLILLVNPLSLLSSGFWLSFVAVTALFMFAVRSHEKAKVDEMGKLLGEQAKQLVARWIRPQFIVFVALTVPLVFFTQRLSLLGPIVNVVAIPIVGFLLVPLSFIAVAASFVYLPAASLLLAGAHLVLSLLIESLLQLVEFGGEFAQMQMLRPSAWQLFVLFFISLLILLPRGVGNRWLVLPLLLSVLPMPPGLQSESEDKASLRLHVVDVGQGLAAIVQTRDHVLLYDTGAQLSPEFNIGAAVVAPAVRSLGIGKLDAVVVSHGDNDHAGGLSGVQREIGIGTLISNKERVVDGLEVQLCTHTPAWNWDGIEFRFLNAGLDSVSENNSSCVLQVRSANGGILLPGDIEAEAEAKLVLRYGKQLASTLLLAPHHGSQSSSSYALLKKVRPSYAVFSAGYRNSFGHPHDEVVARYSEFGIRTLNTATSGMITVVFGGPAASTEGITEISLYREKNSRYWH